MVGGGRETDWKAGGGRQDGRREGGVMREQHVAAGCMCPVGGAAFERCEIWLIAMALRQRQL